MIDHGIGTVKLVLNEQGCICIPKDVEHRTAKADGVSYEDNYKGNALAAIASPGKLEIRYHRDFDTNRVVVIMRRLIAQPRFALVREWTILYQGRSINIAVP